MSYNIDEGQVYREDDGEVIVEIEVSFIENEEYRVVLFDSYEMLGVWISNNYQNKILEIVVSED
ncbi:hypothetical protein [Clostridium novyi]|uniref:hypothetical protein n=1 Tax=Clostridium novyi TaxID=1542 RepID=UPI0004D39AFD|nr:hypothetical protein [Clostridium novyi]KEH88852.1 hypothetical protein Z964_p0013 [Clostridium novyi A str. GD211209]